MAITLVFLGKLADLAGHEIGEVSAPLDWERLLSVLAPPVANATQGEKVKLAVNGKILADKRALAAKDGDEIAFLPPVSGG